MEAIEEKMEDLYTKEISDCSVKKLVEYMKRQTDMDINDLEDLHPFIRFYILFVFYLYCYSYDENRFTSYDVFHSMEQEWGEVVSTITINIDDEDKTELTMLPITTDSDISGNYTFKEDDNMDIYFFFMDKDSNRSKLMTYFANLNAFLNKKKDVKINFNFKYYLKAWMGDIQDLYEEDDDLDFKGDPSYLLEYSDDADDADDDYKNAEDEDSYSDAEDEDSYSDAEESSEPEYFASDNQKGFIEVVEKYYKKPFEMFVDHLKDYCLGDNNNITVELDNVRIWGDS